MATSLSPQAPFYKGLGNLVYTKSIFEPFFELIL
jgi:hypothetical protein